MCRNLCAVPPYILCGVRVLVRRPGPLDRLVLRPGEGRSCWCRPAVGETLFGFLPPGRCLLELDRGCRTLCRLALELPPGANVTLWLDPETRSWSWRRAFLHCFYNQL